MNKLIAVALVAATVFVGTFSTQYTFSANYVMRNANNYPNGYVTGTLYYRYDSENALNSRLRYETTYTIDGSPVVSTDIYYYGNPRAIYSICDKCSASALAGDLEPWWKLNTDQCSQQGEYFSCKRSTGDPHGVVEMVVKSGDPSTSGFSIKSIKLYDGNELEFTSFGTVAANDARFDVSKDYNCPETVECKNFMDLVFVLDASGSVDDTEWGQTRKFVENVVNGITIGKDDAYVGVIKFNGPVRNNCGKDFCPTNESYIDISDPKSGYGDCKKETTQPCTGRSDDCKRYYVDYRFDTSQCTDRPSQTGEILLPLTMNGVSKTIREMKKGEIGMTCQRYGLKLAYDMLFNNNSRCVNKSGRMLCPTPVVIVVTDGYDNCPASTLYQAERLRTKMNEVGGGGFLLEVGVGLTTKYDADFLVKLSSKIVGFNGSMTVSNYSDLTQLFKDVLTPVCSLAGLTGGSCGPTCNGFCACSKCVCPMCGGNGTSQCKSYQCDATNALAGCGLKEESCVDPELERTKCYDMWCDADEPDPSKKCKSKVKDCKAELEAKGRTLSECEYVQECVNGTTGCSEANIKLNHTFCQLKAGACKVGVCAGRTGCRNTDVDCKDSPIYDVCKYAGLQCNEATGQCEPRWPQNCNTDECSKVEGDTVVPLCVSDDPCVVANCDKTKPEGQRCSYTPKCGTSSNACRKMTCDNGQCDEELYDTLDCPSKNTICVTYTCDATYNNGTGGCKPEPAYHEETECTKYECDEIEGWKAVPRCTTDEPCKVAKCLSGGICYDEDIDCREVLNIEDKCHDGECNADSDGCRLTVVPGTYIDICGNCKSDNQGDAGDDEDEAADCVDAPPKEVTREGLAGAAVALIVIGAIILGAAIAASTVFGTKALIDRARGAENQAVVSNPLFEESQTEMNNPAFVGDTV